MEECEEGAAETMCDQLTGTPIPSMLCSEGGGNQDRMGDQEGGRCYNIHGT